MLQPLLHFAPDSLNRYLPSGPELARLSYYALSAGVLAGLPAVVTGITQAIAMVQKQDLYEADHKTLKPKIKTLFLHAALNDVVLIASGWYWWTRRQAISLNTAPEAWQVGLGAVLGVVLLFAANLGGTLVYNYGTGFRAARSKGKQP